MFKKLRKEKAYKYTVFFESAEEGGYTVTVPALPGLTTEGDNLREARKMVKDAIQGYLESLIKHHEPIPKENKSYKLIKEKLEIPLSSLTYDQSTCPKT